MTDKNNKKRVVVSDLVYGHIPPQKLELEKAILGAIMLERDAFVTASQYLFSEAFYVDAHQRIYESMQALYDKGNPIDLLTVVDSLRAAGNLELVGGPYAITVLTNNVTSSAHLDIHCKLVLEAFMKREAIRIGGEFIQDAYEDESDAFDLYNKTDNEIINTQERVLKGESVDITNYAMKVADQHAAVKMTGVLGLPTKIKSIDKAMCGMVEPDLIIVAARPGQGKTAFALSIVKNVSIDGDEACGIFSLEMDGVQLVRRLASMDSGVPHYKIRNGTTNEHEEILIHNSLEKISNKKIYIEDKPSMNIRDIRTRGFILKRKYNIRYIIVDYLQLMSALDGKGKTREQVISDISRGLKILAKELHIPVIALSQLSRAVESRPDKMPQLADLRESGAIEQDADEVIFLMRPEYYKFTESVSIGGKEYPVTGLIIGLIEKNRHGSTKNVAMAFNGELMRISTHPNDLGYATPSYEPVPNFYERQQPDEETLF